MKLSKFIKIQFNNESKLFTREDVTHLKENETLGILLLTDNDKKLYYLEEIEYGSPSLNLKKIKVIGHRGNGRNTPMNLLPLENTIDSYNTAILKGAHMIELDVHLTLDKELIVFHDGTINNKWIPQMTSANIFGLKGNHEHSKSAINTLKYVFESLPEEFPIYVEIKYEENDTDYVNYPKNYIIDLVEKLIQLILQFPSKKVMFASFSPTACFLIKTQVPNARVLLLVNQTLQGKIKHNCVNTFIIDLLRTFKLDGIVSDTEFLPEIKSVLEIIKTESLTLMCYGLGANDAKEIQALQDMGVDSFCTDDIPLCLASLKLKIE